MPRSKEIQEHMRNKIVDVYQSGKGYKAISKALGLQRTTVRAIIHKWRKLGTVVNLPRSGRPTKITPRAQQRLIQDFWANILWTDETKVELFGRCVSRYIRHKINTAFQKKKIIPTFKHGGGSVMVWGCFAASGPGWLAIIDGTMNSALYPAGSLWPQAQAHLGYASGQWSQTQQQVNLWMAQEKQN